MGILSLFVSVCPFCVFAFSFRPSALTPKNFFYKALLQSRLHIRA